MKKLAWFLSACQFFISGCAIHPAPENYSGRYTLNIVQSIRCEARDGFRQYLVNLLSDKDDERFKDQSSKDALAFLKTNDDLGKFRKLPLNASVQKLLVRFDHGSIIYDFRFLMTENNNNSLVTTLEDPLRTGLLSVAVGAGTNLQRQNQRTFRVVDLFAEFFTDDMQKRCSKAGLADGRFKSNMLYPITGKIGLGDVIWTYMTLVQTVGLSAPEAKSLKTTPTFIERLTFTTTLRGDVNPTLELNPGHKALHVAKVEATFGSVRSDEHEVTIAIGLNPEEGAPGTNGAIEELERQQLLDAFQARRGF